MSTKRTPIRRNSRARLSPEIVALYARLKRIHDAGDHDDEGPSGRYDEYRNGTRELRIALGIKPWGCDPVEAETQEPPDYMRHNPLRAAAWREAREWRQQLEAAAVSKGEQQ